MDRTQRVIAAVLLIALFPLLLVAFLGLIERALRLFASRRLRRKIRPILWVAPAFALMGAILVYPLIETARLSFMDPAGRTYVGWENYIWVFASPGIRSVLTNTVIWTIVMPAFTLCLGLLAAVLLDQVRYERLAKSILILPTAISFVAAAVVWKLAYAFRPSGSSQVGTFNAMWTSLGFSPVAWSVDSRTATYSLILIVVWTNLGFALLVLSAGLKGIPSEIMEAARVDGATPWQTFRWITISLLRPTILVVLTTLVVWALKIFDIVYVFTQGRYGTDVIGHRVYQELFAALELGRGSALAMVLFVAVLPFMIVNIRRMNRDANA